jgi:cellulose synthase operon protein C
MPKLGSHASLFGSRCASELLARRAQGRIACLASRPTGYIFSVMRFRASSRFAPQPALPWLTRSLLCLSLSASSLGGPSTSALSAAGLVLSSLGCAAAPNGFAAYPAQEAVHLSPRQEGPEVDALVTAFYEQAFDSKQLRSQLASVLSKYPQASRAHEVAGYLAMLDADAGAVVDHFVAAASDLDSTLTPLFLWELDQWARTATEDSRVQSLLEALVRQHPVGGIRDRARTHLASLLRARLQVDPARVLTTELGYLSAWNLIGPFDNDQGKGFLTSYPPESKFSVAEEYPGKLLPVRWRKVQAGPTGAVALDDLLAPKDFALGYLATFVGSDRAGPAELRVTVGEAIEVWWNDALVASEETIDEGTADNLVVPIQLQAGWNKLLLKSCVRKSAWSVAARVTQPDGAAWPGLRTSVEPQTYTPVSGATKPVAAEFLPRAVLELASPARREFLSSRFAAAAGRRKQVLPPLERFSKAAPGNALATYRIALTYWRNDELGKAIDLLNAGAQRYPDLAGFPLQRARYYRQKKLWDQAFSDLQKASAARGAPGAAPARREIRLELAQYYQARSFTLDQCRELSALIAAEPDLANAHIDLAQCYDDLGYAARSEAALRAADALEPGNVLAAQRLLGLLQRRLDYAAALELNARLRALDPFAVSWQMQRANIERRRGERQAARTGYDAVRAQDPDYAPVYERLADLAYEDGRAQEAAALYKQALERNPSSAELAERVAFLEPKTHSFTDTLLPTEEQIDAAVRGGASVQALPGSNTVLLLDHEVSEIENDGSAKRTITRVTRAENQQGVDQLTKVDLPYRGSRKVLRAYALGAQGERQEASSIQDSTVRFRKLDPGSITVLQYTHYQPSGDFLPNHFADTRYFQRLRDQLEKTSWVLVHDKVRKLEVAIKGNVKEARVEQGDRVIRTFSAEHVAPLVDEPLMPPPADVLQQVSVTTLNTWDEYLRWEKALLSDAFRTSPELEALAAKLTRGAATPRDKLDQLFHAVATDIRYQQEYETSIAGVRPHTAPVVLERGYGDCKDKAVLLIQLAKLSGLRLQFAVLRTTRAGQVRRDIPNQQFNHAIVYVPEQPGIDAAFFLDPTTDGLDMGNLRADDQGALALVMDSEGTGYRFIPIPYQAPELDYETYRLQVKIKSPTEASAVGKLELRGDSAADIRQLLRNPERANKSLQGLAAALFTGATLQHRNAERPEDLWHPLELELELDVSSAIQTQGDSWRLPIPAILPDQRASTLSSRRTPIQFGIFSTTSVQTEVELPEGYRLVKAPAAFDVDHACFAARRRTQVDGRRVKVGFDYTRRCPGISVDDYSEYRKAALNVQKQMRDEIVFTRDLPKKR